jgi:hypothetical protein
LTVAIAVVVPARLAVAAAVVVPPRLTIATLLGHALPLLLGLDRTGLNLLRLRLRNGRRSGAGLHLATIPLAATALPATALATALLPSATVFTTPVFTAMVIAAAFLGKGRGRDGAC